MSNAIKITAQGFEKILTQPKPVLIDFWAPWCGPCRMQGPILDLVAQRVGDGAIIGKVNVDEESHLAGQFGIQSIPTLVIVKDGALVKRFVGVQQADTLVNALQATTK